MMKWSILVLTIPERQRLFDRLRATLRGARCYPDVELCVLHTTDGPEKMGENRQRLLESAQGDYVCFIDDDDLVPTDYVECIRPLLDGVDYVGFPVEVWSGDQLSMMAFHSLAFKGWYEKGNVAYRDISHLNPIRRELAIQAKWLGAGESDRVWSSQLRNLNIVKTEHYIPTPMYFYFV